MRVLLFCTALLLSVQPNISAQEQEFTDHGNGLIYSDTTMGQLHRIVDSLNLRFKTCDLNPRYFALAQTVGYWVHLEANVEEAAAFLEKQPTYEAFLKKFPSARTDSNLLVVRRIVNNEDNGKKFVEFEGWPGENAGSLEIPFEPNLLNNEIGLVFKVDPANKWRKYAMLSAWFFKSPFEQRQLPAEYARLVQYVDCMIDTTTTTYLSDLDWSWHDTDSEPLPARKAFFAYVDPPGKQKPGKKFDWEKQQEWLKKRAENIENNLSKTEEFKRLLAAAVEEAIEGKKPAEELEVWAGRYLSPKKELQLKRVRRVRGTCSMDESPRIHALEIAQLAAATTSWEVFLRSHLDIMNDRFSRMTDGSYAWGRRGTYIRELELLGIEVPDLLMGSCLRFDDPAPNHYFANVSRTGRALSESQQYPEVENRLKNAIADPTLDDFNRLLLWYLYDNMTHWRAPEAETKEEQVKIHAEINRQQEPVRNALPPYIVARLDK